MTPKWKKGDRLYPAVAWLTDADFLPMGEPETTVECLGGAAITHGLLIHQPFGPASTAILSVHSARGNGNDGGTITLAITNTLHWEPTAKPAMDMTLLSNPRRHVDGYRGDEDMA